jgi:alcohol dehydrogenase class IV
MEISSMIHCFFSPPKVLFGVNSIKKIGLEGKILCGSKAILVTDSGMMKSGLVEQIGSCLEASGISYVIFDKVKADAPVGVIEECVRWIKEKKIDIVVGVGGGSSLDTAKGAAIMAGNLGTILDYAGNDLVPKPGLPKILISTTAGTGSEVTRVLIVTDEKAGVKRAIYSDHALAEVAIVDPMLTLSMPSSVTVDTGLDALVHAIETFVAKTATPFSDMLALEAIRLIVKNLPAAYANGDSIEARYGMALGALMAGFAFGSGGLGAVHALAYPLASEYHLTHGRSNAVILLHVMAFNLIGNVERYGKIGEAMGAPLEGLTPFKTAQASLTEVRNLLSQVNVSTQLRDYGIPKEGIYRLVQETMKFSRLFVPNPRNLTESDVGKIYTEAW